MTSEHPKPPFPSQKQPMPGSTGIMDPRPDHGEESYKGSGRLKGLKAIITGGDSGIGRAVAIAYAREGADVLIAYLSENDDAQEVKALVEKEGRKAILVAGDISDPAHCRAIVKRAVDELGGVDILVNNAAHGCPASPSWRCRYATVSTTFPTEWPFSTSLSASDARSRENVFATCGFTFPAVTSSAISPSSAPSASTV